MSTECPPLFVEIQKDTSRHDGYAGKAVEKSAEGHLAGTSVIGELKRLRNRQSFVMTRS
jgi:hypothetical protein